MAHANEQSCTVGDATYIYAVDRLGDALVVRCETEARELSVPDALDGHAVTALGDSSFAKLLHVTSITCPDGVRSIGQHAFEQCHSLERIAFPAGLEVFDPGWIAGCTALSDLALPGKAAVIPRGLFGSHAIRRLRIGPGTRVLEIPRAQPLELERLEVDADSLWLATDGCGLYSYDYDVLFAITRGCGSYRVADGCTRIASYAFAYREGLAEVELPCTLEEIDGLAFLNSGITSFRAPAALRSIGRRAFMGCAALAQVELNEGLREIGEGAFARTGLEGGITVPSTVRELGASVAGFPQELEAGKAGVRLAEGNDALFMDGAGLIYRREPHGLVLADASCFTGTCARPDERTVEVGPSAFKNHRFVERAELLEGIVEIGESAFANCLRLTGVELPSTLEAIGDAAFLGSSLKTIAIPARCARIGERALDTTAQRDSEFHGQRRRITRSVMRSASVEAGNPAYYVENGLLCRRFDDDGGNAEAVLYVGPDARVAIPREVTRIGAYAFSGATGIDELVLHPGIAELGTAALFPTTAFGRIVVELDEPIDGHESVSVELLPDESGMKIIRSALYRRIDAQTLLEAHDATVPHYADHFDRFSAMLARLADPVLLADWARTSFERALSYEPQHVCLVLAGHDCLEGIDQLISLGFATGDDVAAVLDKLAGDVRSITSTARLLHLKHAHFADHEMDYAL